MKVIVFDTETNNLLPKCILSHLTVNQFPHIVQLSYIIYDLQLKKVIKTKDFIVKCPIHIMNSQIHGITDEISQEKGINIGFVMGEFVEDMMEVDQIICHNYLFDAKIVESELFRLEKYKEIKWLYDKPFYCTMIETIDFCKLEGKFYGSYKYPRLQELHIKLFNCKFQNAHNSLCDSQSTLRCYLKFAHGIDQ